MLAVAKIVWGIPILADVHKEKRSTTVWTPMVPGCAITQEDVGHGEALVGATLLGRPDFFVPHEGGKPATSRLMVVNNDCVLSMLLFTCAPDARKNCM